MASHDSFELTDADLPRVIDICRRLDGIPLALELAAGQVASLGLEGLLRQLQGSFRQLTPNNQSALGRHQTPARHPGLELRSAQCLRTNLSAPTRVVPWRLYPDVGGGGDRRRTGGNARGILASITQLVAKSLLNVDVGDERGVLPPARHHAQLCPGKTRTGRRVARHPRTPCQNAAWP